MPYAKALKRKAINSILVVVGGRGDAFCPMKVILILACLLPPFLWGQENGTKSVDGRLVVFGGESALRVAMVQDAEILIKDLDRLAGAVTGKPIPIVLQLFNPVRGKPSQIGREFIIPEGTGASYELRVNLRLGEGNAIDQAAWDRVLLEFLLIERTLRALPPEKKVERVEMSPWLVDGVAEAILWRNNKGDRRMYESLMESGGWVEVEKLVERKTVGDLDVLSRELFRASSGALVMALLAQPQGDVSLSNFLGKVAAFEGEQLTLLRTHFPQVNLGAKGLERWWMLQVASMSEQKLSEAMTIAETEARLAEVLEFHLRDDEQGQAMRLPVESWMVVVGLETAEERVKAVRPASDLLAHLSFRCFPTYRPVIAGYLELMSQIAEGKGENVPTALVNLQTFRTAEVNREAKLIDLLDWYHLSSVKEESGEFEDYLRVKKSLEGGGEKEKSDPLNQYLNEVEAIFAIPVGR